MSVTIDSTLGDLLREPGADEAMIVKLQEVAIGHSINESVTLAEVCQHVAFVVRPQLILYINDRVEAANGG